MELRTNRTQQGAGAPGRRVPPFHPGLPQHPPQSPREPSQHPRRERPQPSKPLPQQRAEPAGGRGAGGVSVSALLHCSPSSGRSPDPGDFVPDMPCPRSKSLVTLLPRPLDPEGLDHEPRPDQGSDGRKPDSWLGKMSVVQESQRAGEGISGSGKNSVCQGAAKGPGGFEEGPSRRGRGVRWLSSLAAPVLIPEPPFTSRASSGQWHNLSALQRLRVQNADDNNSAHLMRLL